MRSWTCKNLRYNNLTYASELIINEHALNQFTASVDLDASRIAQLEPNVGWPGNQLNVSNTILSWLSIWGDDSQHGDQMLMINAINIGISINGNTPKWMVYKGKIHLWFRGNPISGNLHLDDNVVWYNTGILKWYTHIVFSNVASML